MSLHGNYDDMVYMQRCEEAGPEGVPPPALAFTGADMEEMFGPNGPDEDDIAALNLAMDRNMAEREHYWQQRAERAEARLRELEGEPSSSSPTPEGLYAGECGEGFIGNPDLYEES